MCQGAWPIGAGGRLPRRTLKIGKGRKIGKGKKGERKRKRRKERKEREGRGKEKRKKENGKGNKKERRWKGKGKGREERKKRKERGFLIETWTLIMTKFSKLQAFSIKNSKIFQFLREHIPPQTPSCARKRNWEIFPILPPSPPPPPPLPPQ